MARKNWALFWSYWKTIDVQPRVAFACATMKNDMIYRMRIYQAVSENLPNFHRFFREHLLPVQLRHGARLIGRWETEDGRVIAIWEYDDLKEYERINEAVSNDPDSQAAQEHRKSLGQLFTEREEVFMHSTV